MPIIWIINLTPARQALRQARPGTGGGGPGAEGGCCAAGAGPTDKFFIFHSIVGSNSEGEQDQQTNFLFFI